jgi:hypothetical protein
MQRTALAYYPAGVGADPGTDGVRVGVDVIGIVRDDLVRALERVGGGEASAVFVARLADAASSSRELVALFDWLDATGYCDASGSPRRSGAARGRALGARAAIR